VPILFVCVTVSQFGLIWVLNTEVRLYISIHVSLLMEKKMGEEELSLTIGTDKNWILQAQLMVTGLHYIYAKTFEILRIISSFKYAIFIRSFIHSFIHSFFLYSFTHSSCIYSSIHLFIYVYVFVLSNFLKFVMISYAV
jgi:hypothetical protein